MDNEIAALFLDYSCQKLDAMLGNLRVCLGKLTDEQIWQRNGAHENAVGALSKYRMATPRRNTQRLASRTPARSPMTCGGYETAIGLGIEVWHAACRFRCERRHTDRDCTLHKASSALAMDPAC